MYILTLRITCMYLNVIIQFHHHLLKVLSIYLIILQMVNISTSMFSDLHHMVYTYTQTII